MTYSITSGAYAIGTIKRVKKQYHDIFIAYVNVGPETWEQVWKDGKGYFMTYADANMAGHEYYLKNKKKCWVPY